MLRDYLAAARAEERPMRDNCRVVLTGMFCEQPPLNLIKSLEMSGCYVVDDDLLLVTRWLHRRRADRRRSAAQSVAMPSCTIRNRRRPSTSPTRRKRASTWCARSSAPAAEGVIFAAPSFCDPALLDRPMLQHVLKDAGIPYIAFKYAENSGQMQPIREQAGTFADSIKLWSGA